MFLNKKGHLLFLLLLLLFTGAWDAYAQMPKKLYVAKRIFEAPDIDGFIGEEIWNLADVDSLDEQYLPYNGKKSSKKTEFRILYDDKALYIAALLYDNPDSILSSLGRRDEAVDMNADQFVVDIGPYNDGINSFSFMVSSSGVQSDFKNYNDTKDLGWNAVWKSKSRIIDRGWVVEMKIPYSAIYFPKNIFQVWSLNLSRIIKRKEEISTWNLINREMIAINNQAGELIGIERIKPPFRMAISPFAGVYSEKDENNSEWKTKFKSGFDLKYGINQSFSLEATFWPDFNQVAYDDSVLNVSPFELKYPEKRDFFNDGSEMFTRADLYYSRRVGLSTAEANSVGIDTNEIMSGNSNKQEILNAFKLTGRNSKNLGFGLMNAMSNPVYILVVDTLSGIAREIKSSPFTNYNVFILDKTLSNNSFISFINTNRMNENATYMANVSATEFRFSNSKLSYAFSGIASFSQIKSDFESKTTGFKSNVYFDKTSGRFQFRIGNELISDKYNQNDIGFLTLVNEVSTFSRFNYNIYEPFWKFLNLKNMLELRYTNIYNTGAFADAKFSFSSEILFSNQYSLNVSGFWRPFGNHDYYEARQPGRPFIKAPSYSTYIRFQTDPRRMLSISLYHRYWGNDALIDMIEHTLGLTPYFRFQSRFRFSFDSYIYHFKNSIGFAGNINDSIFMGQRDITAISNTANLIFSFTDKSWITLKVRHYWSNVLYNKYYYLKEDGRLSTYPDYPYNTDRDYQILNLDLAYKWEFSPGSELSLVWKNLFNQSDAFLASDYFQSFDLMMNSPHFNQLSVRFLYYFDFIYLKKNGNQRMPE